MLLKNGSDRYAWGRTPGEVITAGGGGRRCERGVEPERGVSGTQYQCREGGECVLGINQYQPHCSVITVYL